MNIRNSILIRVRVAFLLVLFFSMAVVGKILHLQWVEGDKWRQQAQEKTITYRVIKATRGNIYSDNGSFLATSLPYYRLVIDPTVASNEDYKSGLDSLCLLLARHYKDLTPEDYRRKINDARMSKKRYLRVNSQLITYPEKKEMETWPILRKGRYRGGVIFEQTDRRFKPFNHLGWRTIGYMNASNEGAGLEYSFNRQLAGRDGEALFQRMSGGNWKPLNDGSEVQPEQGWDIYTTLDINLQDVAEAALLRAVTRHNANYGCVVLMEVQTGEVKAIANLGKLASGGYGETYNYAVAQQGRANPGSTFKLASIMTLLEETSIEPTDSIDTDNGVFRYKDVVMNDSKPGGYGKITIQEAFERSSNVAFVKLMREHFPGTAKEVRFLEYLRNYGFTSPLGFQLVGEAAPYVKKPGDKTWSGITLPWMAVGYELELSPLHVLTFYNAVANGGKMISPVLVKETRLADKVIERYRSRVINEQICSEQTLAKVRRMLEGVVERGTARNIRNNDYKIAGKTGTSQKFKDGRYRKNYYTSFAGYFPADKPKYSCIVVIDEPQGVNVYGSDVAAPVFKEIADKIYARDLEMHKALPELIAQEEGTFPLVKAGNLEDLRYLCNIMGISNHARGSEEWVIATANQNSIAWRGKANGADLVPDVTGMTLKDALFMLENKGLRVNFAGHGRVLEQSQAPGLRVVKGSTVTLRLGG